VSCKSSRSVGSSQVDRVKRVERVSQVDRVDQVSRVDQVEVSFSIRNPQPSIVNP